VTRYRPFRNSDPPALVRLWNQGVPEEGAVRPLRVHELDVHAFGSVYFERAGLIVAERDGRVIGYAHAGFGPDQPVESTVPFVLDRSLGTIAMLVVESSPDAPEVAQGLILQAEHYLRQAGANVLYAGGQFPLNPFYWGLYAGSEGSGVLPWHPVFPQLLISMGYEPVGTTAFLEYDLSQAETRDPRAVLIRRQTLLETDEEASPENWWESLALGEFRLTRYRLLARSDRTELARASTWDMNWFGRRDGRSRLGIFGVEVAPGHRRKGYGRFLVGEVLRSARELEVHAALVQTGTTNLPALNLYQAIGFQPVDQSTVYRLPAHLFDRSSGV
jgi:ribosomal protein S18 acetylase RimI-like enzyme